MYEILRAWNLADELNAIDFQFLKELDEDSRDRIDRGARQLRAMLDMVFETD